MADTTQQSVPSPLSELVGRFVVAGDVLACDVHAEGVREFARKLDANEPSDEAILNQIDESLRCLECRLIAAAVLGDLPPSEDEDQRALDSFLHSRHETAAAAPSGHRGRTIIGPWRSQTFVFASIAASLFAVFGSVLGWQNHRLRQETRLLESRIAELGAKTPGEHLAIFSYFEPTDQPGLLASRPIPTQTTALSTIAVTLVPGLSRSIVPSRESSVELTEAAQSLALRLILDEGADSEGIYSATIEGASGKILYSAHALKSVSSTDAKRIVTFTVPAGTLAAGGYIVRLGLTTATAGLEVVNDYRLFVAKRESMDSTEQRLGTLALTNDTGTAGTITVADRSVVMPPGLSTVALPPGEFLATILSKCGMVTQSLTIRLGMQASVIVRCVR